MISMMHTPKLAAGLAVLGFQIVDYGYIPNAVPMEGGMCS